MQNIPAMGSSSNIQDWPNLNRYKKENIKLQTVTNTASRIVFLGDSITEKWKTICPEFFANSFYINRGIGGQTTPQLLLRFRSDVIELKPNVVVILAGTNDIAENTGFATLEMIIGNLLSMVELAQANKIKVILCSVLPAYDFPWKSGLEPAPKIIELNKLIAQLAHANGIVFVNYFSVMTDIRQGLAADYSNDGVHPNKKGYQVMTPLILEAIRKTNLYT